MTSVICSLNNMKNNGKNKIYNTNIKISLEEKYHIVMKRLELEKTKSKELQKNLELEKVKSKELQRKINSNKKDILIRMERSIISDKKKTKSKIDYLNNKIKDLYSYVEIIENSKNSLLKKNKELIYIIKNMIPKTDISNECKICYHNEIDCILSC